MTARSFLGPANPDAERRRRERWRPLPVNHRLMRPRRWYRAELEMRGNRARWRLIDDGPMSIDNDERRVG